MKLARLKFELVFGSFHEQATNRLQALKVDLVCPLPIRVRFREISRSGDDSDASPFPMSTCLSYFSTRRRLRCYPIANSSTFSGNFAIRRRLRCKPISNEHVFGLFRSDSTRHKFELFFFSSLSQIVASFASIFESSSINNVQKLNSVISNLTSVEERAPKN